MITGKFSRLAMLGSVAAGSLIAAGLQSAYAQESGGIEEIVVTAQKVKQNIRDVGMSITALSADQLSKAGITKPDDLMNSVPGFTAATSAYGPPVYSIRGVGYYDTIAGASPAVTVYTDEVPLPFSTMTRGASYDLERVEVLKGPQGTLYGQNVTGGALNFILAKPTDSFKVGGNLGYASYDKITAGGFISGPINSKIKMRFSAEAEDGGAWQKSYSTGASYGATHFYGARLLTEYQANDALKFSFNFNGWVDRSDQQAGQFLGFAPPAGAITPSLRASSLRYPATPPNARYADWDQTAPVAGTGETVGGWNSRHNGFRFDNNFMQGSGRVDYNFGNDMTLSSISTWGRLVQGNLVDGDGMNFHSVNVSTNATVEFYSQEVRLAGKTPRLNWVVGLNYEYDRFDNEGLLWPHFVGAPGAPFPAYVGTSNSRYGLSNAISESIQKSHTYAGFAHAEYKILDNLSAVAGIRFTQVNINNFACTIDGGDRTWAASVNNAAAKAGHPIPTLPANSCATLDPVTFQPGWVRSDLNQHNVPWKAGLNWKVTPNSLIYASASRGYKAGTFSAIGAFFSTNLTPAVQESVIAYEIGAKLGLLQNHLQLDGSVFYYDYQNKQVRGKIPDPILGTTNKEVNVPRSRIAGFETNVLWVPDEHWRVQLGGTYTDSMIKDFVNFDTLGVSTDMYGDWLPYTPKWTGLADVEYNFPITGDIGGYVGTHVNFMGSFYSGLGNLRIFRSDKHTNVDLRAGAETEHWTAQVYVNNVTDEYSINGVNAAGSDVITAFANPPRIFGVRLSVKN